MLQLANNPSQILLMIDRLRTSQNIKLCSVEVEITDTKVFNQSGLLVYRSLHQNNLVWKRPLSHKSLTKLELNITLLHLTLNLTNK